MLAGVSTACFYPTPTENSLLQLGKMGVKACELFINSTLELKPEFLRLLRGTADFYGTRIVSLHPCSSTIEPFLFFSNYPRRFDEGLELFRLYYQAAAYLGAKIVVFHGNRRNSIVESDIYFEHFDILHREAAAFGVELCQENVSRCTSGSMEFLQEMAKALPNVRFVFDTKQAVRAGYDVSAFSKSIASRIAHVHLSDNTATQDCLLPWRGTFNIPEFLLDIKSFGIDPAVIVEVYSHNYMNSVEISASYQQLCSALSTLR